MRVKCRDFSGALILLEYCETASSGVYYNLKFQQMTGEIIEIKNVNAKEIEVINAG